MNALAKRGYDELLLAHVPLVRGVVDRMRTTLPAHLDAEDLYSVGLAGLSRAVAKYDPAQEGSFAGYATMRIRGAVLDELRSVDWMSRGDRQKEKQLTEAIGELEQGLGRAATAGEVAGKLALSNEEYLDLLEKTRPITFVELDSECPESEGQACLHETIADRRQESACERLQRKELVELLAQRLSRLPENQRRVLAMYYFDELRLAEIAVVFGVTESRICQIHTKAVSTLRNYLQSALAD